MFLEDIPIIYHTLQDTEEMATEAHTSEASLIRTPQNPYMANAKTRIL
jgi:hypothetical protein